MAYEYDRFEREEGGGSFLMGLLAGTVLGAGLGMLFAPKAGSELRSQLGSQFADQTGKLRDAADQGYQQASEKVSQIVDRGREASTALARASRTWPRPARRAARLPRRRRRPPETRAARSARRARRVEPTAHKWKDGRRPSSVSLMTEKQARTTANLIMAAAALGAAVFVLATRSCGAWPGCSRGNMRRGRWPPGRPGRSKARGTRPARPVRITTVISGSWGNRRPTAAAGRPPGRAHGRVE